MAPPIKELHPIYFMPMICRLANCSLNITLKMKDDVNKTVSDKAKNIIS